MISTVILVISFIFSVIFFKEWRKQARTQNEQYIPLALTVLYVFLFIATSMMIYSSFFASSTLLYTLIDTKFYFLIATGFIVIVLGIIIFIAERIIRKNTKHFFLLYFFGTAIILMILKLNNIQLTHIMIGLNFIISIPFLVLIVLFLHKLLWKTPGKFRQKMLIVVTGFGLFIYTMFHEVWYILNNEFSLLFGTRGAILAGSILLGLGFHSIKTFTEFDWKMKIRHLYLLNENGLCLFQQSFKQGVITDEDLLGGSLMAVQSLMKEMIQSEKAIQAIDHGDVKILFDRSPHVICIVIAEEQLYIIQYKIKQLLHEFEILFGPILDTWSGNLAIFQPFQAVVNKIFELS